MDQASSSEPTFKPPPVVECISQEHCLGFGKKIHDPDNICAECLKRHDPQQLRLWSNNNSNALALIEDEVQRKETFKRNIEAHGRYLCAFEDPDFQYCRWRLRDLNLRGTRLSCSVVRRKGAACAKCWRRHLQRIGIVQYFTPTGLCHEQADKIASAMATATATATPRSEDSGAGAEEDEDGDEDEEYDGDDDDDDVEGYNEMLV